ncbi:hypothetical protein BDZ91DRAFT_737742, partial [Kalaharituber pfeilii]
MRNGVSQWTRDTLPDWIITFFFVTSPHFAHLFANIPFLLVTRHLQMHQVCVMYAFSAPQPAREENLGKI